jgi:hypothetical protein
MLTREGLAELRRDATYRSGMGERMEVNPAILLQMLDVCDAHAELAVQCVDCKGYMSPKNPDLTLLDLAARTCLCPRCKSLRERAPKPGQPTRPGNFWHKCARPGNEAKWHPVSVEKQHRGLFVYHIGSDEDYDIFDLDGEWGAEIVDPAEPAPTA